MQDSVVLFTW